MDDVRVLTSLPSHPKTKKLIRRIGEAGAWHLVCLFLWARANRSDGDLSGMTAEDVELAVDWRGEPNAFVGVLTLVGFLDGPEGNFRIHDWADHNPWSCGAKMRSLKARWNAVKRHHGEREADLQVPEWAVHRNTDCGAACTKIDAASSASSKSLALHNSESSNALLPLPLPLPSPPPKEKPLAQRAARFGEFWSVYPVKKGRQSAEKEWTKRGLDSEADRIIADVKARIDGDSDWLRGYVPHGSTYIHQSGWLDALPPPRNLTPLRRSDADVVDEIMQGAM